MPQDDVIREAIDQAFKGAVDRLFQVSVSEAAIHGATTAAANFAKGFDIALNLRDAALKKFCP